MNWEKTKLGLWSALGGAIVATYVGFNIAGWVTGGAAQLMAKELAENAVAERLGKICVAQLNLDTAKTQKLLEMKDKDAWQKGIFIDKHTWAIMPGDQKPDSGVAEACARQLSTKT